MNTDSTLDNLSHSVAITLLKRIYGINNEIDDIIENHLQAAVDMETNGDGLYQSLQRPDWAKTFEHSKQLLAAIICYRGLLNDILQRGNAKAYHHAARYFHKLLELDKTVQSYQNLDDSASYIRQVQQQHWRKRSFWAEADYPNKPN